MSRFSLLLTGVALLGIVSGTAWAQETPATPIEAKPDFEKAQKHYQNAEQAMQSGDFKRAAAEYQHSYDASKDTTLFFKLGVAHQKAGDCPTGLTFFRRYLAEGNPDAQFKTMTNEHIAACENPTVDGLPKTDAPALTTRPDDANTAGSPTSPGDLSGATSIPPSPAVDESPPDSLGLERPPTFIDQKTSWQRNAAWLSVGLTVSFITAGAVLGLSASSREEDISNLINYRYPNGEPAQYTGNTSARYDELVDEGEKLALWSRITFGIAGVTAATAVTLFLLDPGPRGTDERTVFVPTVSPSSVGAAAHWRF